MEERDFFKDPFSEAEIRGLSEGRSVSDVFAWRSPSFKSLGLKAEDLGDDDLVRLMLQEPRLVRRPMIRIGNELVVGGSPSNIEKALEGL